MYKAGTPVVFVFRAYDITATPPPHIPLTGLILADLEINIFLNGIVPGVPPVPSFNEIGDGYYSVSFTPNTIGWWGIFVKHILWDLDLFINNFKCTASDIDDVAILVPSGTVPVSITVEDPSPLAVPGASLAIWDSGHTTLIGHVQTNSSGEASFTIVPGDYEVWPYKTMYDFAGTPYLFTAVLGSPVDVDIVATPQFIRRPSRAGYCVVWGFMVDVRGKPVNGVAVEAIRDDSSILTGSGEGLGNKVARTHTNVQGYFELELIRGQLITARIPGQNHQKKFIVPDQSNIDFFSIIQLSPP